MNKPAEYVPISEVAYRASLLASYSQDNLHARLEQCNIFAEYQDGHFKRIDSRVLARCNDEYLFIDDQAWVVAFNLSSPRLLAQEINRGDLNIYPGGFTAVDAEYDERLGEVISTSVEPIMSRITEELDNGVESTMLSSISVGIIRALSAYRSMTLHITETDVENLLDAIASSDQGESPPIIRFTDSGALVAAWKDYNAQFTEPDKPNYKERIAWGKARGLTKSRVEGLQRDHSPEYWKKRGRMANPPPNR